jgi:alkanesulfonate monooxygenase SsuD/methylene tetrahydromethanopterin reductase-like flavin-dependent oxidoreductase (luciferase family)
VSVATPKKQRGRGRHSVLTAELQNKICRFIRAGTYDYVAAEASGISRHAFFDWIRRGEGRSDRPSAPIFVKFVNAVREAQAEARASAEVTVRKMDPKWWLSRMHRDKPNEPGWSDNPQVQQAAGQDAERITLAGLRMAWEYLERKKAIEVMAEKVVDVPSTDYVQPTIEDLRKAGRNGSS